MVYLRCVAGGTEGAGGDPNLVGEDVEINFFLKSINEQTVAFPRRFTWIKCNKDFRGFYLTKYSEPDFESLTDLLDTVPTVINYTYIYIAFILFKFILFISIKLQQKFSIGDQANILNDAYTQAFEGSASYVYPALTTTFLQTAASSLVPWRVFTWHIGRIATILEQRASFVNVKNFAHTIVQEYLASVSQDQESLWNDMGTHTERLLKTTIIDLECRLQDLECLTRASAEFEKIPSQYFQDPDNVANPIGTNLRPIVYKYHIQNTYDFDDWYKMEELYTTTSDPQERAASSLALTFTRQPWIIDQ